MPESNVAFVLREAADALTSLCDWIMNEDLDYTPEEAMTLAEELSRRLHDLAQRFEAGAEGAERYESLAQAALPAVDVAPPDAGPAAAAGASGPVGVAPVGGGSLAAEEWHAAIERARALHGVQAAAASTDELQQWVSTTSAALPRVYRWIPGTGMVPDVFELAETSIESEAEAELLAEQARINAELGTTPARQEGMDAT